MLKLKSTINSEELFFHPFYNFDGKIIKVNGEEFTVILEEGENKLYILGSLMQNNRLVCGSKEKYIFYKEGFDILEKDFIVQDLSDLIIELYYENFLICSKKSNRDFILKVNHFDNSVIWESKLEDMQFYPHAHNQQFALTTTGLDRNIIYCINLDTGKINWERDLSEEFSYLYGRNEVGLGAVSMAYLASVGDIAVVPVKRNGLLGINLKTGEEIWRYVGNKHFGRSVMFKLYEDFIYQWSAYEACIQVLNPINGKILKKVNLRKIILDYNPSYYDLQSLFINEDFIFFGYSTFLYILNRNDFSLYTTYDMGKIMYFFSCTFDKGYFYILAKENTVGMHDTNLYIFGKDESQTLS